MQQARRNGGKARLVRRGSAKALSPRNSNADVVAFNGYAFVRTKMTDKDYLEIRAAWPNGIF
jgi:hypothetical protein